MKTIFEQQGVEYRQAGDYMLPDVELTEQTEYQIGVWGQRYKRYLKSNHRVLYYNYLTSGRLYEHLAEVDTRSEKKFQELVKSLAENEKYTDKIKPKARANLNGKLSLFLWCKVLFNLSEQTIYTPIVVKRSNLVREHPKTCQKNR